MRTFVLPDVLHELPAARLLHATWNRKVSVHVGKSGSHGFPCEGMVNGARPPPIHPHSRWSVAIAGMPLDSCAVFAELRHNDAEAPRSALVITRGLKLLFQVDASLKSLRCTAMREPSGLVWWWDGSMFHIFPAKRARFVFVCSQIGSKSPKEPLNGTYKLTAKWASEPSTATLVWVRERHSAIAAWGLFLSYLLIIWLPWQVRLPPPCWINYTSLYSDAYGTLVRWKLSKLMTCNADWHLLSPLKQTSFSVFGVARLS